MVFSILHWLPSALAAICVLLLVVVRPGKIHRVLSLIMVFLAFVGLIGFITTGEALLFSADPHNIHAWIGLVTLLLSLSLAIQRLGSKEKPTKTHCRIGYVAGVFSTASLVIGALLLGGYLNVQPVLPAGQQSASSTLPEVEAKEYLGVPLTPLSEQGNNTIKGTQYIDRQSYRLTVTGLVDKELNLTLDDLHGLPAYSELAYMPCVEGWGFTAKWTGFRVIDLLDQAGLKQNASYAVFYTYDGYSTGLPLSYLREKQILMAYGINDVTLPPDRGFPFQLVAQQKYGYKWAKWITQIQIVSEEVYGYWESRGYSDSVNAGEYPFR
jgi:hypothetical protein